MYVPPSFYFALAVGLGYFVYHYILYSACFSPLAKIPAAHPITSFTSSWMQRQAQHSRELKTLYSAHQQYGPIVRIGPMEVSVVSQEGLEKIYVAGLDKHPWYRQVFYAYGHQNLVATLDHKTHSAQKRMIAKLYTKRYLQRSDALAQLSAHTVFERLSPLLHRCSGRDVNAVELFEWTGVDFISGYVFGKAHGTDFLRNEAARERYFHEYTHQKGGSCAYAEQLFLDSCKAALGAYKTDKGGTTETVVFISLYTQMNAAVESISLHVRDGDILSRCASEVLDPIIATQETNTITWTYILYRFSLHPDLQVRLRSELQTVQPCFDLSNEVSNEGGSLPSPADIDSLPFLEAVIMKTLRLHAANPARMRRVVPPGDIELHGIPISAGTTASTNAYCLHRIANVFPQPLEWRPERWLDPASREEQLRWFWAFDSGPRMCIGNNFECKYTTTIVGDEGIEQSDSYNSGPVGHWLMVKFEMIDGTSL